MPNMFENAYFGKQYKLKNGKKAIYVNKGSFHYLAVEGKYDNCAYYDNGTYYYDTYDELNVVSEWKEEINEEKLDELADAETFKKSEEFDNCLDDILSLLDGENKLKIIFKKGLIWAFKVGYRKKNGEK